MGALTLKAFSDELREWEFIEGEGIDPTDSFGASLRLSIRENQIFLAEPNDPDTPWLTDKGRLFFDGMFEKSPEKQTNWKAFFNNILELMYFIDHLNFHKKNVSSFIFAFENLSLETLNMLYLIKQNCIDVPHDLHALLPQSIWPTPYSSQSAWQDGRVCPRHPVHRRGEQRSNSQLTSPFICI